MEVKETNKEMITAEEVIRSLPALLREKTELRWEIYGLLQEEFVTKSDFHEYMKKSDERFEKLLRELRAFREDSNRRFDEINTRFEEMRGESNRRFEEAREENNRRFEEAREESNRRFEEMREEMNQRFAMVHSDFNDLKDWVGIVVGHFQTRAGRKLEDAIAGALRIALKKEVSPENITLRKKIMDEEGLICPAGRKYEIDLYITNEESLVFEIKSVAEEEDIERFNDKAELAIKKLKLRNAGKALITLDKHPSVVKLCNQFGITVG